MKLDLWHQKVVDKTCSRFEHKRRSHPFIGVLDVINKEKAIQAFADAGALAYECNLGLNAGHDLSLDNLKFFKENLPHLLEVSIGHALISDALYYGLENTIMMYRRQLQ